MGLASLKSKISKHLNFRAQKKHYSKLGWRNAPKYSKYAKYCASVYKGVFPYEDELRDQETQFNELGFTVFWDEEMESIANSMYQRIRAWEDEGRDLWKIPTGDDYGAHQGYKGDLWRDFPELERAFQGKLGELVKQIYRADYKIFFGLMVKSEGVNVEPVGSQLWHNDAGPGSCIIIANYLHETDETNGCLQVLPWKDSLEIYRDEWDADDRLQAQYCKEHGLQRHEIDKTTAKTIRHHWYDETIQSKYKSKVQMPFGKAGSTVLFRNNILHRGGHPAPGKKRYALLIHCYPANTPAPFDHYREHGIAKTHPYPVDPGY
ncbi:phytanoyl-CoA dioxygenase family protein [Magnetovibrio sp.]|uniref:phytanoyl-CoA dioxygenase family protein n=1 Tax=Magnetovibrio sp. TaxID=2024836 RepID=UPI002F9387DC